MTLHGSRVELSNLRGTRASATLAARQKAETYQKRLKAMTEDIPYITSEPLPVKAETKFPIHDLMSEIVDDKNISDSFDYVISHLECAEQREHERPKKKKYCKKLKALLSSGEFRITEADFRTIEVTDGPKDRIVQCPTVFHRVGCHAVMVPFEKHTYPTLITNTAASIKGRGMHWLHQIIEEDILADPEGMRVYYQSDILHFYDNISQSIMKMQVREYTDDPLLLPIMDNFITLLPEEEGLSKGLRSSQCLANLHLSEIDHKMCQKVSYHEIEEDSMEGGKGVAVKGDGSVRINGKIIRYHYYRYCDDIVICAGSKKELWALRDYLVSLLAELGLQVKPNEAVRPLTVGLDYLGFDTFMTVEENEDEETVFDTYSRVRKRTKKKFCRRMHKVKSRKRRQSLIGSFFGMAAHADCRHLLKKMLTPSEFRKLKHKRKMKDFGDFKVAPPTLDGKKNFKGQKISSQELDRKGIIVVDFERDVVPRRERDDYTRRLQAAALQNMDTSLVEKPKTKYIISLLCDGQLRKLWTGDREIWQILEQIDKEEDGFPFFVGVVIEYGQYRKMNFVKPSTLGLACPSDEEVERLMKQYNLI